MAIDFPNSPSVGQTYSVGNRTWKWDGTTWSVGTGAPALYVQDAAPSSPSTGDQWYESDTGRWFLRYDSAWVEIGNSTDVGGALQPGQVTALSAVTSLTTDDVFPVIDNPSSAVAANKITYGNLIASLASTFPKGIKARAVSSSNYTLTTSLAQATGMSVTFTAEASRYYKVIYFEPQAQTATFASNTALELRQTSASGTQLAGTLFQNESNATDQQGLTLVWTGTFSAGSVTLVGCAKCNQTTGTPLLIRSSTQQALLLVEDIGVL